MAFPYRTSLNTVDTIFYIILFHSLVMLFNMAFVSLLVSHYLFSSACFLKQDCTLENPFVRLRKD